MRDLVSVAPSQVVQKVNQFIREERIDVEKWDNREFGDDSSVFSLHRLAAEIYHLGLDDGWRAHIEESSLGPK
jgi:hypothetical protein